MVLCQRIFRQPGMDPQPTSVVMYRLQNPAGDLQEPGVAFFVIEKRTRLRILLDSMPPISYNSIRSALQCVFVWK